MKCSLSYFKCFFAPCWKQFSAAVNEILDLSSSSSNVRLQLFFFFLTHLDVVKTVYKLRFSSRKSLIPALYIQQWWIKFNSFSTPRENKIARYKSLGGILSKTNSFTSLCSTFFSCCIYSFLYFPSSLVSPGAML